MAGKRGAARRRLGFNGWLVVVFAVALLLRVGHIVQVGATEFGEFKLGDAKAYDAWGQEVAGGDWLGDEVFYQAPLYPYFLGAVYATLGDGIQVVRLVQGVLSAVACVFLALAGRRFLSDGAGIAAGLIVAVYAPSIFLDGLIQKSVLDLFLLCLLLWLLGLLVERIDRPAIGAAVGATIGALVLTRENALVFIAAVICWALVERAQPLRARLGFSAVFLAGLLAVLLPVALRNQAVGGEFHLTTSQLGPNLYLGNNAETDGTYHSLLPMRGQARYEREDAVALAEQALGRKLTPGEVSNYWVERTVEFARERPGKFLALLWRKFALTWNATEICDTEDQYTWADWSFVLRTTGLLGHFGVLAPLALAGVFVTWPLRNRLRLLYLMLAVYMATGLAFVVYGRYRYPMVPFLALLAGAAMVGARDYLRRSPRRRVAWCLVSVAALAVFAAWPMIDPDRMRWTTHFNFATQLQLNGELAASVPQYRAAIATRPDYPEAYPALGRVLLALGKNEEAVVEFRNAIEANPFDADARFTLGVILAQRGDYDRARAQLEATVRLRPDHVMARFNLANLLYVQGDPESAAAQYEEVVQLDPAFAEAQRNLGHLRLELGDPVSAAAHYQEALRLEPTDLDVRFRLGEVLDRLGEREQALEYFRQVLRQDPAHAGARQRLAARGTKAP